MMGRTWSMETTWQGPCSELVNPEVSALRAEVAELREEVARLAARVEELSAAK